MATKGYQGVGTQPAVAPYDLPLPNESWDQYLYRLYNQRQYDQNRAIQDQRTQAQLQSSIAERQAQMLGDAAYQRSQQAINAARNQMTITDLNYQQALDKDRDRNTRVGSVTQSYRNTLGGY